LAVLVVGLKKPCTKTYVGTFSGCQTAEYYEKDMITMAGETPITIVGNLTDDPQLNYTKSGAPVANFSVAVSTRVFDKETNEWSDGDTTFWKCSIWREYAENIASSLAKGQRVIVQGNVKARDWTDQDGNKRTSFEIETNEVGPALRYGTTTFTPKRKQTSDSEPVQEAPKAKKPAKAAKQEPPVNDLWDE
jgi:single-strand DNA-binding protein